MLPGHTRGRARPDAHHTMVYGTVTSANTARGRCGAWAGLPGRCMRRTDRSHLSHWGGERLVRTWFQQTAG